MKITDRINDLNDLKLDALQWIEKNMPGQRQIVMGHCKDKITKIRELAVEYGQPDPFSTEERLIESVGDLHVDSGTTNIDRILMEIGFYALAWDEMKLESTPIPGTP